MSSAACSRIDVEMTIAVFAAFAALLIYRHGVACCRNPVGVKKALETMAPEFTGRREVRAAESVRRPGPDLSGVLI